MNKWNILIVDRQDSWRGSSATALSQAGYEVYVLDNYEYPPVGVYFDNGPPDLIILGCASIKREERKFIKTVLADGKNLLVLSASLPWSEMRSLFLQGASDVTDKTYDPENLVNIVKESLDNLSLHSK